MNIHTLCLPIVCVGLFAAGVVCAQESPAGPNQRGDLESLKQQMLEMQAHMQQLEAQHQQELAALKAQVEKQQKVIDDLQKAVATGSAPPLPVNANETATTTTKPPTGTEPLFPTTDESVVATIPPPAPPATSGTPSLAGPLTIAGGGKTFLNVSFDGQFSGAVSTEKHLDRLEVGDHDPQQRGFNARNIELALDGAVDPYFDGFANIVFTLDNHNETSVEVEEAFMQTTTLPWSLQVKGGQFFAPFGRINPQHPHAWDFVDSPLVNGRLLGPDGLRGVGAQVSWLAPLPWYSQLLLAVQNGNGSTGFSFRNRGEGDTFYCRTTFDRELGGPQDLVFIPRFESSLDLTPTQTVLAGLSGAFGPNDTGATAYTQIYGADVFYKWKSAHAEGGWPYVKWQTEALLRHFEAGRGVDDEFPVRETFNDWGVYSQVVWGFRKGWTAGLRGDYLQMEQSAFTADPERQSRWRMTENVTWYPTEFSKLRLQYNHDFLEANEFLGSSAADSVFLQFEFALGAHAAHKF